MATRIGWKPRPTRIGAAMAAGVPKPLAPSIRKAKAQPTIIAIATLLVVTLLSQVRIVSMAPVASIVLNNRIAPRRWRSGPELSGDR